MDKKILLLKQENDEDQGPMPPTVVSKHASHQEANGAMQEAFDTRVKNLEADGEGIQEKDDSNASHFYIIEEFGTTTNWWIVEVP